MLAVVAVVVVALARTPVEEAAPQGARPATSAASSADDIPECAELPDPSEAVVATIAEGGPFDHPQHDGGAFGNYEDLLPQEERGYYREYTVETPGLAHRGSRRVVTGGVDADEPERWYFTKDHYESFCEFAPAG